MVNCPCTSGKEYDQCCGLFISGKQKPETPEELMRSRYTAYSQANIDYIIRTMKSPAADGYDSQAARAWAQQVEWLKLDVLQSNITNANKGFVEFQAHYFYQNKRQVLHEVSEFHRENNQWYYVKGILKE